MKLQIIELESQDDRASVRDRLAWSQAPRVVLVYPNRGRTRLTQLDLVLLHREAALRGRQLALVTRHPVLVTAAEAAAIPHFPSLDEVREGAWLPSASPISRNVHPGRSGQPGRLPPRPPILGLSTTRGAQRWLWIGLAAISLLAMAAAILPSADALVTPISQTREQTVMLEASPGQLQGGPGQGLASRQVEVRLQGKLRLPTTGTVLAPVTPAVGTALFTNLTSEPVSIPEGTSVRPTRQDPVRFITTVVAELPAGQGSTVSVSVAAVAAGSAGNLAAGSLDSVDGPLGLQASVSNPQDLSGGSDRIRSAVAPADLPTLQRALEDQLFEQARLALQDNLQAGESLLPGSLRVVDVVEQAFDLSAGEAADSVGLWQEVRIGGLALLEDDLKQNTWDEIEAAADPGWIPAPGSLTMGELTPGGDPAGRTLDVAAHWTVYRPVDRAGLARAIRGLPVEEARQILLQRAGLSLPPEIIVRPAWLNRVPWVESRIRISLPWEAP